MAKTRKVVALSLLDRLTDESPEDTRERPPEPYQVMEHLRQSVRTNLQNLLNTRVRPTSWPEELEELAASLINFGIPDITAAQLQSEQKRKQYLRDIENRIRFFEPRLQQVVVRPVKSTNYADRSLRFQIDAALIAEAGPEPIVFDSEFDPIEGSIKIQDGLR